MFNLSVIYAFLLTLFAGTITVVGGLFAICSKKPSDRSLSLIMGFSAGMMLFVSFVEILQESSEYLEKSIGNTNASWIMILSFICGMVIVAITDRIIPHHHHDTNLLSAEDNCPKEDIYLYKTGMATMLAIGLHNFPEGLAMFSSMLQNINVGLPLVVAVCLHNIPVGLAIAAPIYAATHNKKKSVLMSLIAGLYSPLGALLGYAVLRPFLNDLTFGVIMGAVAGIMVFVSVNEIYPAARRLGKGHSASYALIVGMAFMGMVMQFTGV